MSSRQTKYFQPLIIQAFLNECQFTEIAQNINFYYTIIPIPGVFCPNTDLFPQKLSSLSVLTTGMPVSTVKVNPWTNYLNLMLKLHSQEEHNRCVNLTAIDEL